ncbi:MAG: type III polyketide synthase [Gemmatimonadales bacterium]
MSPAREVCYARRASPAAPMQGAAYRAAAGRGQGHVPATGTSILSIGRATPALRVTQERSLEYAGYTSDRIRRIFLNTGIAYRHFYFETPPRPDETSDELNRRYLDGAMATGGRAVGAGLEAAGLSPRDVDLLVVCTSTGYACPDIGTRLVKPVGLRPDIQRASMTGLGCAGALPALQRACDFAQAHPGRIALVLAVEICSACYYVDDTLETVVGNAICADGASAFLLASGSVAASRYPRMVDFQSLLDPEQLGLVGMTQRNGKLRIVLGAEVPERAPSLTQGALTPLLARHGLRQSDIRFWVVHPGGSKVLDTLQTQLGLTDADLRFARTVLRNYGNMSSPTVMFVLDEVVGNGDPRPGDWGVMTALGPGMAAEAVLLRW